MKSAQPLIHLTSYYAVLALAVVALLMLFPDLADRLPVGAGAQVTSGVAEFMSGSSPPIAWEPLDKSIRLTIALVGVLLLMEPVAWVYMGARRRRGREQSFVLTLLLLPVVVAGIVLVVQNSLALAFSLAGIVAGVRFRLTLDDTLDAIYIFVAIAAGLAAGIEALEIVVVVSVLFNYVIVLAWELDYAEEVSENRWFTRVWMNDDEDEDDDYLSWRQPSQGDED